MSYVYKAKVQSQWCGLRPSVLGQDRSETKTGSSSDADKPSRRVYRSVKVNKHLTIPYVRYSFLLCNSSFVFKTHLFFRYSTSKMPRPSKPCYGFVKVIRNVTIRQSASTWLKNFTTLTLGTMVAQGHLKVVPFDRIGMVPISVL